MAPHTTSLGSSALFLAACGLAAVGCGGGGSSGSGGSPASTTSPTTSAATNPITSSSAGATTSSPTTAQGIPPGASLAAFETHLYPVLRTNCQECHASDATNQLPQAPFLADPTSQTAHDAVLPHVSFAEPDKSRLVIRLAREAHNSWTGNTQADAQVLQDAIQAWADALRAYLPAQPTPLPATISEADVDAWIAADKAKLDAADAPYIRYVAVHEVNNEGGTFADMEVARVGVSKTLNSHSRYGPKIVNPVAIDPYDTVFRVDVRDYFGFTNANGVITRTPDKAIQTWDRITSGDRTQGVMPDYVTGAQLAYSLSRPETYNDVLEIPGLARQLEAELGVDKSQGVDSYKYMIVNRKPITIEDRIMMRADLSPRTVQGETAEAASGYYWSTTDVFSGVGRFPFFDEPIPEFTSVSDFSQIKTVELLGLDVAQTQAQEIIFSLPNGMQAYMIAGAVNQRRVDAFTFIVVDPLRGGPLDNRTDGNLRLLNGISCQSCHEDGMKFNSDAMRPYLLANQAKFDAQTYQRALQLYPGDAVMQPILQADTKVFTDAAARIQAGTAVSPTTVLNREPIYFLALRAQQRYGYTDSTSN